MMREEDVVFTGRSVICLTLRAPLKTFRAPADNAMEMELSIELVQEKQERLSIIHVDRGITVIRCRGEHLSKVETSSVILYIPLRTEKSTLAYIRVSW